MTRPWMEFSAVDASRDPDAHARYLEDMAQRLTTLRRQSLERLPIGPGASFLDAGCGLGELAIQVAEIVGPTGRAVGIDVSEQMLRRARASAEAAGSRAEFASASVTSLPFADATFDIARSERVFQHLDDDERVVAARELLRVVRPGGAVQIADPDHTKWGVAAADRDAADLIVDWTARRPPSPESGLLAGGLLRDAGAVDVEVDISPVVMRSLADWWTMLGMHGSLEDLVERGELSEERAAAFWADLERRDRDGVFLVAGLAYVTTVHVRG
jgi:SAM-dependent methyltransferase